MTRATAFAPATVANCGPAFDALGFAIGRPAALELGDRVPVELLGPGLELEIEIAEVRPAALELTRDPEANAATAPMLALFRAGGYRGRVRVSIEKGLPIGSGLGSSAASAAAGVAAANAALGSPYPTERLVTWARLGEAAACGTGHLDNIAPALLGGFVLVRDRRGLELIPLPVPSGLFCTVVTPDFVLPTSEARRVLPETVTLEQATRQLASVALLISALYDGDLARLGRALEDDIVEPARARLIPGYSRVKQSALDAGALGAGISGAGPSLFAWSDSLEKSERIGRSMVARFGEVGLEAETYSSPISPKGVQILEDA